MNLSFRTFLITGLTVLLIQCNTANQFESDHEQIKPTPWTNLNFKDQSKDFNFAIVSDRTGGERPGVFEDAIFKLNKLKPAFVISIGDLIGSRDYKIDSTKLNDRIIKEKWLELNKIVNQLEVPFFYTVGNNDIRNKKMENHWVEQFGQTYYYFMHNDILFIVLNTEDPPGRQYGKISDDQLNWFSTTLHKNESVKWTFVFLHRPMWLNDNNKDWQYIEEIMGDRSLTVFAGHKHEYSKTITNNHIYYALATTGGGSQLSGIKNGEFDHIVWVSMSDNGPAISNLMLNGIWGDNPPEEAVPDKFSK